MHEILTRLPPGTYVLDLGSAGGSFAPGATAATIIQLDRAPTHAKATANSVCADAAALPFVDNSFRAVISNHSLEHFEDLNGAISEIARVLHPDGALYVAVPDASTFTDRLYRWLARGGGHVNPFVSAQELSAQIEKATGLPHRATRTLYSSLSFLNRRNGSPPRRLWLLGGGTETSLRLYTWLSRRLDRAFHTRTSIYGWALYFGHFQEPISESSSVNVCVRCGSATPAARLTVHGNSSLFPYFHCPLCGTANPFSPDPA